MEWYVYMVRCADRSFYTGVTNDVLRRVQEHNTSPDQKAYTFRRRPVTLAYSASFTDVNEAIAWEKHVKKWSRAKKEALCVDDANSLRALSHSLQQPWKQRWLHPKQPCHPEPFDKLRTGSDEGRHGKSVMVRQAHHDTRTEASHEYFMQRCLELAKRGRGFVGNGALVGAVLVREGVVIAEGVHTAFGRAHAERDLLQKLQEPILPTDVLYVNLEPCCHEGKTPPCTDLLIKRGMNTVVIGMQDPDSRNAGKGIAALREAGITVMGPILEGQCLRLNRGFVSMRTKQRPWITLKRAQTKNGEIAHAHSTPKKITSAEQDVWSHTHLRATHDAILVGIGTVISDNPLLNTRFDQNKRSDQRIPYRIVLDKNCILESESKILQENPERTIVVVREAASKDFVSIIGNQGARVLRVPVDQSGDFAWPALWEALCTPRDAFTGITSILVEGGRKTWDSFRAAGIVDEDVILVGS